MSDLIRREDAYAAIRGLTRHIDRIAAIRALPAVQPDTRIKEYEDAYQYALHLAEALRENFPPNPDFRFLGDLVGLLTQIDNMVAGLSQPAAPHVNETPKSEHDAVNMLTLTAERDRLREALRHIVTYLAEPTVASEDTLNSLRGDLRFVGRVASAALKGETL